MVLPVASRVKTAYEYWVSGSSPASVTEVAGAESRVTAVPVMGLAGGVVPAARRTMIWARSASVGLVHDRLIEVVVVAVTLSPVTGPGGVVSSTAVGVDDTGAA